MEYLARFLMNAIGGSIVTFYAAWLFVILIRSFVRLPRARYYLLLLPFLKVFYDLLFMNHTSWVFYHGKKVLGALPGSRQLMVYLGANWKPFAGIRLQFFEGETFSIGDLFVELFGVPLMFSLSLVFLLLTLLSMTRFISQWIASKRWQMSLSLTHQFDTVYSTTQPLKSPLLIGSRIVIPHSLFTELTPQEIEAIQMHEKEHLRWKDNGVTLFLSFLAALFWFIPFRRQALKQGHFYRELACDQKAQQIPLLSALLKTAVTKAPPATLAFSASDRVSYLIHKKALGKTAWAFSLIILVGGSTFIFASEFLWF